VVKKADEESTKKALPFKRANAFMAYPEDLHLEKVQGQKHYDPRVHHKFVERDVKWIMRRGVLEAVKVDKCGSKVVVIDGRQRVINALEANRRLVKDGEPPLLIPVVLKRGDPATLFEFSVIANEHRQADNHVTQAFKFQQYMNLGRNEEDCAELWGVDKQTVKRRIKLLELCPEVQQAVAEGRVTSMRAIGWCNLSYEDQRAQLEEKKPAAAGPRRPSPKRIEKVLTASAKLSPAVRAAIEWAAGHLSDQEAAEQIKGFELEAPAEDAAQAKFAFAEAVS